MFKNQSLDGFLTELSSRNPTPGGGSAAGLAAAMGVALVEMVANVVGARDESEKSRLAPFVEGCEASRAEFVAMMDQDSAAFEGYMTAMKLPKTTDNEKLVRRVAMQLSLIHISEPTRLGMISYAVFCLKKKKKKNKKPKK